MCSPIVNRVVQNWYTLSDFFFTYLPCRGQCNGDLYVSLCLCRLLLYLNPIIRYKCVYFLNRHCQMPLESVIYIYYNTLCIYYIDIYNV